MKVSCIALLTIIGVATASKPQLSIQVKDGSFADLDGLEPTISWETSGKSGDVDLEAGIKLAARATGDLGSLPKSIWGKASGDLGGWGVSARAEVESFDSESADLEIEANDGEDLSLKLTGSLGKDSGLAFSNIEATKTMDSDGAAVSINPRYNIDTEEIDVVVGYSKDDTSVKITASKDEQEITVSQKMDDDNTISPTFSSSGDISVEWERSLGGDDKLTTTLKPNESIDVEWDDGSWTANINVPIDGTAIGGTNVSIKRDVSF
eukprot:CAMPEP_0195506534 /NCGR_PEP_ID=MMETSP0794_2-20130614/92_1 /TAXON_ID=515487 /ORGANISM="Stephanopyxis turris, Strain CCMP 815" /LENGTH=264 /DNA_ID=CAMNT_0040632859 /DNA_START=55 /DNA_END=849 /DNA_ORIENTATION=+